MDKKQTSPKLLQAEFLPAKENNNDAEPQAKQARATRLTSEPVRLTRKNLALFNKMGKKKTSDPSDDSGSTKTISTTASGFAIQAYKNGVLDPSSSKPPKDLEEIY
ncbi:hypothetical protein QC763_0026790 [Podospora pseudopauciseta]|uniref:Uncharacterized protein n=1 Tax=Podospora pseudopauciseta TaxID=2093780 RepID=A0ABR0I2S0_9PEZI|nr:hypothetical protein QC763_0026790 [Podospora pseudopauciseta]